MKRLLLILVLAASASGQTKATPLTRGLADALYVALGGGSTIAGTTSFNNLTVTGTCTGCGGAGSAAWGAITGTLSAQTDLQNALNLKAPLASPTFTGTVTLPSGQALVAPVLGTPASVVLTNATGTAAGLTAGLATALAANGSNCLAGFAPLGVDASGNVEGCTAYLLTDGTTPGATTAQQNFQGGVSLGVSNTTAGSIRWFSSASGNPPQLMLWGALPAVPRTITLASSALTAPRTLSYPDAAGVFVLDSAIQTLTNKTLTIPTIVDFTNANHNHQNAAGGGTLGDAALALSTPALGTPSALVCTNCTGTAASLTAGTSTATNALNSATTVVNVAAATAPTNGQVLTATGGTAATWQTPSSSGATCSTCTTNVLQKGNGANTLQDSGITEASAGALTTGPGVALSAAATAPAAAASTTAGATGSVGASNATAGTTNAGAAAGGQFTIAAGSAARLTSGNANGGNVVIKLGNGIGSGTIGNLLVQDSSGNTLFSINNGTAGKPMIVWGTSGGFFSPSTSPTIFYDASSAPYASVASGAGFITKASAGLGMPFTSDGQVGGAHNGSDFTYVAPGVLGIGVSGGLGGGYLLTGGRSRVSTQFDKTTSTTLANVPMTNTVTLASGRTYTFRYTAFVAADVVGGSKYAVNCTCSASAIIYNILLIDNTSNSNSITSEQTSLGGSSGQAGTTTGKLVIEGTITTSSAGNLSLQFAQNASNGTSSIKVGSFAWVEDTP